MRSSLKIRLSGTPWRASKRSTKTQGQARSPLEPRDTLCTAPHQKNSGKFRQTFSHFLQFYSQCILNFLQLWSKQNSPILMSFFRNSSNLYGKIPGKYQNLLDSRISWDFVTNILKISENDFREVRKG